MILLHVMKVLHKGRTHDIPACWIKEYETNTEQQAQYFSLMQRTDSNELLKDALDYQELDHLPHMDMPM